MNDKIDEQNRHEGVDESVPEFMSGMADELEYIPRNERLGRAGRLKRNGNTKWLLAIAALVLIVVMAFTLKDNESSQGADALETSLSKIEGRLKALETKIARIEANITPHLLEKNGVLAQSKSREQYHVVLPGDTLSAIAGKYGLTVEVLCKLNQLTVDEPIKPGQKLLVSPN